MAAEDAPRLAEPVPQASPRVAPEAAPPPPPEAERALERIELASPEPQPDAPVVEDEPVATAPPEAAPEIVTEAEEPASEAPAPSTRPRRRPERLAAAQPEPEAPEPEAPEPPRSERETFAAASTPEEPPEPEPEPQQDEAEDFADAIAAAVSEANTAETAPSAGAPAGPPMTFGEKEALKVAVGKCWNVGSLSTEASRTTVVVSVRMRRDGKPDTASIRLEGWRDGSEAAAQQAFEAAKRAINICGRSGFPLPPEKYEHWAEIEMTFNPEGVGL